MENKNRNINYDNKRQTSPFRAGLPHCVGFFAQGALPGCPPGVCVASPFLRLSFVCLCFVPRGCGFVGPPGFEPGTFRGGLFSFMVVVPWVCLGGLLVKPPHASVIFGSFSMTFLGACCCVRCLNVGLR